MGATSMSLCKSTILQNCGYKSADGLLEAYFVIHVKALEVRRENAKGCDDDAALDKEGTALGHRRRRRGSRE